METPPLWIYDILIWLLSSYLTCFNKLLIWTTSLDVWSGYFVSCIFVWYEHYKLYFNRINRLCRLEYCWHCCLYSFLEAWNWRSVTRSTLSRFSGALTDLSSSSPTSTNTIKMKKYNNISTIPYTSRT